MTKLRIVRHYEPVSKEEMAEILHRVYAILFDAATLEAMRARAKVVYDPATLKALQEWLDSLGLGNNKRREVKENQVEELEDAQAAREALSEYERGETIGLAELKAGLAGAPRPKDKQTAEKPPVGPRASGAP